MNKNSGVNHSVVRNGSYTRSQIKNIERHNERKNEVYTNPDVHLEESNFNIHFKRPSNSYINTFDEMCDKGVISTKGLKADAVHFDELLFDVNTLYFEKHGGYEFAAEFFEQVYQFAIEEVGGEEYILSAVMHADELNTEVSKKLGKDVYHYHLHVVYVPVVQKEVKWTKRCKEKDLIGTVKEVITQVSHSKKWASHNEIGKDGKPHLVKSYSLLQDRFSQYVNSLGYDDISRGERGSTQQHISTAKFKTQKEFEKYQRIKNVKVSMEQNLEVVQTQKTAEEEKLEIAQTKNAAEEQKFQNIEKKKTKLKSINSVEVKPVPLSKNNIIVEKSAFEDLKTLAKKYVVSKKKEAQLSQDLEFANAKISQLTDNNENLKCELNKTESIAGRLSIRKDKLRIAELVKFKETVYTFLKKLGLEKQFKLYLQSMKKSRNEVER